MTLLPPNSTPDERALEDAMLARFDLSAVGNLRNPQTCPAEVLPLLGGELAISHWDTEWSEAEKRAAVADAIPFHKIKGTRAAVEQVLARFHDLLTVTEWHETTPRRTPGTFEIRAPSTIPHDFLTPETAEAIIRDVAAAKPLRSHFDFVQTLEVQSRLFMASGAMGGSVMRSDASTFHDTTRDWSIILQTEDGEPILLPDGSDYLETE